MSSSAAGSSPGSGAQTFAGQVAVVTGGAQGIGFGVAAHLGALGARVALFDMQADKLAEAVAALAAKGVEAMHCALNVGDAEQWAASVKSVVELVEIEGRVGRQRFGGSERHNDSKGSHDSGRERVHVV